MRRIVVILLALVVAPSMATASWYRCAYDGVIRSTCCCPSKPEQKRKPPAPDASVRAACCCTVTHVTSGAPDREVRTAAPIHVAPVASPVAAIEFMPRGTLATVALARPGGRGDPPETLFARRCSLLL